MNIREYARANTRRVEKDIKDAIIKYRLYKNDNGKLTISGEVVNKKAVVEIEIEENGRILGMSCSCGSSPYYCKHLPLVAERFIEDKKSKNLPAYIRTYTKGKITYIDEVIELDLKNMIDFREDR